MIYQLYCKFYFVFQLKFLKHYLEQLPIIYLKYTFKMTNLNIFIEL